MRLSEADSHALAGAPPAPTYLEDGTTVMSWLNTRDHKRVAVMFLVSVIFFFFIGGVFASSIRTSSCSRGRSSSTPSATTTCSRCTAW